MIFISKENDKNKLLSSYEIKSNFLKNNINKNHKNIFVDDDNKIIKEVIKNNNDILVFQDSSLVD